MIIKKKNKIVGSLNIILGVLSCITWFICSSCMRMEKKAFISFTNEQDTAIEIFILIMAIPLIFTFIINLIYIFRNWHNKKSMFMNILTIISIITAILLMLVFQSYLYGYIILIVALWGILILIFNKDEDEGKKHRTLFGIMILNVILFIVSSIGFLCVKSDYELKYANNEKNLIKNIMQLSSSSNVVPIKAQKNGKFGYIDSNGNTVVDLNYDDCSEFVEIENVDTNKKYYIASVSIGNELRIITNDNKQIASYKNKKREYKISSSYFSHYLKDTLQDDAKSLNTNVKITESKYDSRYSNYYFEKESKYNSSWAYDYDDTLSFDIPNNNGGTLELTYNTKTESVTYNRRKISIDGNLYIYIDDDESSYSSKYDNDYIDTYENGYIPIYNFEKELFGWIDLKGQPHYISGKKQILDFSDKYIAIKDYSILGDAKVYVIDYEGNRVSNYYKEIAILDKGYVVKNPNGKNIYLDENFRQITPEYDIIDHCRAEDGILIVANFQGIPIYTHDIFHYLRFDLININNGQVIGKDFEYISGMSDSKYKAYYDEDLTINEFKEILCSVDYNYLNTKLYEKYYK